MFWAFLLTSKGRAIYKMHLEIGLNGTGPMLTMFDRVQLWTDAFDRPFSKVQAAGEPMPHPHHVMAD